MSVCVRKRENKNGKKGGKWQKKGGTREAGWSVVAESEWERQKKDSETVLSFCAAEAASCGKGGGGTLSEKMVIGYVGKA